MSPDRGKPVTLILKTHSEKDRNKTVVPLKNALRTMLRSYPDKKILSFIEEATGTQKEADEATEEVSHGGSPIDYYARIRQPELADFSPRTRRRTYRRKRKVSALELDTIGDVIESSPGKILFIPEAHSSKDLVIIRDIDPFIKLSRVYFGLATNGHFSEALPLFKYCLTNFALTNIMRDKNVVDTIDNTLQSDTVAGAVAMRGPAHTQVGHELQKRGYDIKMIFPDRENGSLVYPPSTALARKIIFKPGVEISDQEWMITLLRDLILIYAGTKMKRSSDQEQIKKVWIATQKFTIDDLLILEENIQRDGIEQAFKEYGLEAQLVDDKKPIWRRITGALWRNN